MEEEGGQGAGFLECWLDGGRVTSHLASSASRGSVATSSCSLNTVGYFCLMSGLSDMQISYGSRQREPEKINGLRSSTHFTNEKAKVQREQAVYPQSHSE